MKKERLFLIDGNSYCYRAYYAIKDLKNSKGQPTNAVYGFILMLKKLLTSEKPDYIGITFDLKGPTFRHKKFKEYKIKRKPMPDNLVSQMPLIKEVVSAYNIPIFEKEGFEADDILATAARKMAKEGVEVYIVTGDKDALQLVDDNIKVYSTHKEGLVYDRDAVISRFSGLGPGNMADLMALSGDASDNIPGVRGIGEKTAIELIKDFKNIENLYRNLDKVKSEARRKMLADQEEIARLSKQLATVDDSVPIEVELGSMRLKGPDQDRLVRIFKDLDFKVLAREAAPEGPGLRSGACYRTISDKKGFEDFLRELKKQKEFVFDFETTSENPLDAVPVGISFCWEEGKAYYVALASKALGSRLKAEGVESGYAFEELKGIMEDEKIKKIGQNIKYEKLILSNQGVDLKGIEFDTMIASYLLNPSKFNHNLDDLAFERLDHKMISADDLLGTGKKRVNISLVPPARTAILP